MNGEKEQDTQVNLQVTPIRLQTGVTIRKTRGERGRGSGESQQEKLRKITGVLKREEGRTQVNIQVTLIRLQTGVTFN